MCIELILVDISAQGEPFCFVVKSRLYIYIISPKDMLRDSKGERQRKREKERERGRQADMDWLPSMSSQG